MELLQIQYRINDLMSRWVVSIKGATSMSLTDLNRVSETMLIPLLGEVYDWPDLRNLNTESQNFPGIDLADDKQRVAIQVTSKTTSEKVKHSLSEFADHGLYEQYDRLIVYILVEKQKSYSGAGFDEIIQGRLKRGFDIKRDILDYRDLLEVINGFQIEQARRVLEILEANFGGEIQPIQALTTLPDQNELPEAQEDLPPGSHLPFLRNHAFTGRAPDLQAIAAALFYHPPGAARRMALTGGGGSGKTQLAVEFCYRYGRFTYGVHWLDATQSIASQIAACGADMKIPGWENLKQPEQVQRTLEAWKAQPERLVVLDNLDEPPQFGDWLKALVAHPTLVTSRRDDYDAADIGENVHPVQTLPRSESRELLRKLARRLGAVSDSGLDLLCDRLGDLPLALDLAGRYLAEEGIDIPDYLDELAEVETLLEHESFISAELNRTTAHVRSLAATFRYSWKDLQTEAESDLLARRSFLACGYCAANIPIPTNLLLAVLGLVGKAGERVLKRSLNRLYRLGLLAESAAGPVIHPLLAEFARSQDRSAQVNALLGVADGLAGAALAASQTGAVAGMLPLMPHLRQVLGNAEAQFYLEQTLAIRREALMEKHPATATSLNNHGALLDSMGDYAGALPYLEQALAIQREVLGEKHSATASSLNNLGLLLQAQGDYAGALPYLEKALAINREVLGEKHPATAQSLNNLGALLQAQGDYAGARPYFEQALAIYREVLGEKHPDTATSLNNLGFLLYSMGDYAGAQPYFEQALAILETSLPPDHPTLRTVRLNLEAVILEIQKKRSGS